jgi:hypothetical protein
MNGSKSSSDLYTTAHLFVAAIRIHEYQSGSSPSLEDICRRLQFSEERGGFIKRKLTEMGAIEVVEVSHSHRLFIRDHLKIEDIPRGEDASKLDAELKKFKDAQKSFSKKIESFRSEQDKKKKSLFAEMEKKLKDELEKKNR